MSSVQTREISIGTIRDLIIEHLTRSSFVNDDEDIINFTFGAAIPASGVKVRKKLNSYLDMVIPFTYETKKRTGGRTIVIHGKRT